jgi:hypothetical protein
VRGLSQISAVGTWHPPGHACSHHAPHHSLVNLQSQQPVLSLRVLAYKRARGAPKPFVGARVPAKRPAMLVYRRPVKLVGERSVGLRVGVSSGVCVHTHAHTRSRIRHTHHDAYTHTHTLTQTHTHTHTQCRTRTHTRAPSTCECCWPGRRAPSTAVGLLVEPVLWVGPGSPCAST